MFIGQMKGNTDVWQTIALVLQLRRRGHSRCIVSTTYCIDNNVSTHVKESGFRNPYNFCSWNPVSLALESRIQLNESGILLRIGIKYLESGIHGMESRIQDCLGFPCMRQNVSQTRPDRKKAYSLLVYAKFTHRGSVAPLNVILRPYTSSET